MEAICTMARKPKKAESAAAENDDTTLIRANLDMARKITFVVKWKNLTRHKGEPAYTAAQYLEEVVRDQLEHDYAEVSNQVERQVSQREKKR